MENPAGIATFVKVVSTGSFAKAAAALGISAPAVSKNVQRLEASLGVRLLNRTTRRLALTDEGAIYYERCRPAIEELQAAAAILRDARRAPAGVLRVSATVGFGRQYLMPLLPEFSRRYPGVTVDLHLDDRFADLVEDRIDVAIRNGRLGDRNIIARQLASMQLIVCGSPKYFAHHPKPETPDDLSQHRCINFRLAETGRIFPWEFESEGNRFNRSVTGGLIVNDAEAACLATLRGMGLAQIASYQAVPQIKAGRLIPVLTDYIARRRGPTSAISTGGTCRAASRSLSISSAAEYARGISSCVLRAHKESGMSALGYKRTLAQQDGSRLKRNFTLQIGTERRRRQLPYIVTSSEACE